MFSSVLLVLFLFAVVRLRIRLLRRNHLVAGEFSVSPGHSALRCTRCIPTLYSVPVGLPSLFIGGEYDRSLWRLEAVGNEAYRGSASLRESWASSRQGGGRFREPAAAPPEWQANREAQSTVRLQ